MTPLASGLRAGLASIAPATLAYTRTRRPTPVIVSTRLTPSSVTTGRSSVPLAMARWYTRFRASPPAWSQAAVPVMSRISTSTSLLRMDSNCSLTGLALDSSTRSGKATSACRFSHRTGQYPQAQ